jgi:hypothetical protein
VSMHYFVQRYATLLMSCSILAFVARLFLSPFSHRSVGESRVSPEVINCIILAGVFITRATPAEVTDAFRTSAKMHNTRHSCHIRLRFFVGGGGYPSNDNTGDVVVGNFSENMNDGKTFEWLRYAATFHTDVHIVLKIDTDTSIKWSRLQEHMLMAPSLQFYIGRVNSRDVCGNTVYCPPDACHDMKGRCWVYMSGGFYGMSLIMASRISTCTYALQHKSGYEDLMCGRWIKHCINTADYNVINVMNGDAWCHSKHVTVQHIRDQLFPVTCEK